MDRTKLLFGGGVGILFIGVVVGVTQWQMHHGAATVQAAHVTGGLLLLHERTGNTRRGAGATDRLVALDLENGKERAREIVPPGTFLAVRGKTAMMLEAGGLVVRDPTTLAVTMNVEESRRRFGETAVGREACAEADGSAVRFTRADAKPVRVSLDDLRAEVVESDRCSSPPAGPRWDLGDSDVVVERSSLGRDARPQVTLFTKKDGRQSWQTPLDFESLSVRTVRRAGDRVVVVNADGAVAALDIASGRIAWQRAP